MNEPHRLLSRRTLLSVMAAAPLIGASAHAQDSYPPAVGVNGLILGDPPPLLSPRQYDRMVLILPYWGVEARIGVHLDDIHGRSTYLLVEPKRNAWRPFIKTLAKVRVVGRPADLPPGLDANGVISMMIEFYKGETLLQSLAYQWDQAPGHPHLSLGFIDQKRAYLTGDLRQTIYRTMAPFAARYPKVFSSWPGDGKVQTLP